MDYLLSKVLEMFWIQRRRRRGVSEEGVEVTDALRRVVRLLGVMGLSDSSVQKPPITPELVPGVPGKNEV